MKFFKNGILNKYKVKFVDHETYWNIFYKEFEQDNLQKITFNIKENCFSRKKVEHYIIVKDKNLNIAMFRGEILEQNIYYMRHAIVKKEYRGQGIYSAYLDKIISSCKALRFSQIISCFVLSNTKICQLKMKYGFYLTGVETHAEWGQLGWLCHFLNEDLKKAYLFRCGELQLNKKMYDSSEKSLEKLKEKLLGL